MFWHKIHINFLYFAPINSVPNDLVSLGQNVYHVHSLVGSWISYETKLSCRNDH